MLSFFETNTLSRKAKLNARIQLGLLEVKSKFDAEFRRFSLELSKPLNLNEFQKLICDVHKLKDIPFFLTYTDPEGDLLPINNDENFARALQVSRPLLRLVVQHNNNNQFVINGYGNAHPRKNIISRILEGEVPNVRPHVPHKRIGMPQNFRCVSAIIDVDVLPTTQRRVKLIKSDKDMPLGFYIRDGYNVYPNSAGEVEKVYGVFISKLLPGGLAAGTGLLAVNDEILEVNGIEVAGKTLDQVTDMMIANSSNLIITTKPFNQQGSSVTMIEEGSLNNNLQSKKEEYDDDDDDDDDIKEFIRQDPSGSSNTDMDSNFLNLCSIEPSNSTNNNKAYSMATYLRDESNLSTHDSFNSKANLGGKTRSGQIVHNLQSLSNLQESREDLRFVEGNQNFSVNNDCNNFMAMKSNDFYNFTNSSLRTQNKPSSSEEFKRRMSSYSDNRRMTNLKQ